MSQADGGASVTEVILTEVRPGMEARYQEWAARIQAAQAAHPGHLATYLQPPRPGAQGVWTTLLQFDSEASLEAWKTAPARSALLEEASHFIEREQITRLATAFPGWVPVDPATRRGPPNWKTALLVLLGLFPIVMLEVRFLAPVLEAWGLPPSPATLLSNAISVLATSYLTMPWLVRWFDWWLFPRAESRGSAWRGPLLLAGLFAAEVAALWRLLPV